MKYQVYDLGFLNGGETVEVVLSGTEANILLLDSINYDNYKAGRNLNMSEVTISDHPCSSRYHQQDSGT